MNTPRALDGSLAFAAAILLAVSVDVSGMSALSSDARAQPPLGPGDTLRWVLDPAVEPEVVERIEGQTGDLPAWRVNVSPPDARARAALQHDPLALAALLVRGSEEARTARVVIWTRASEDGQGAPGAVVVVVVDLLARRVLWREVPLGAPSERSAALETVGIIVRGALQTLAEGGEIGVRPPAEARASVEDGGSGAPAVPTETPEPPAPLPATERARVTEGMLGGGLLLRRVADEGLGVGGRAAVAVRHERLFLGLAFEGVGAQHLRSADAAVALRSLGGGLFAGFVALERPHVALVPLASLSLARMRRETTRVALGGVATPSATHLDARVGAGLLLRVALSDLLFLTVDVGVELPLRRVRYTLGDPSGTRSLGATPRVAPSAGVGLLARIGRN